MKTKNLIWLIALFIGGVLLVCPALGAVPVASFMSNTTSGNLPLTVQFVDSSQYSPTSWVWLFGDGGMATGQNPTHTYTTAGVYTVTLIATNSAGSNTDTQAGYITVSRAAAVPVVSFITNDTSGSVPLTVQFLDSSTNSPSSWVWSFGDGGTSTSPSPIHTYLTQGQYTVTLTATNAAGSNTTSLSNYITVSPVTVAPTAVFKATVTSGYAPLTVQFVDVSSNSPNSWVWSFGDGSTSTLQNPVHTYTLPGTFAVTLTASNVMGSNTQIQPGYITVNAAVPYASFTSNVTSGINPMTVQFNDTSNNTPTAWYWTFGDGVVSTSQNPVHTYTAVGSYAVSLGTTNSAGSNTTTMATYINVTNALTPPTSSFTANVQSGNAPLTVQFTDTSGNSPSGWQWAFGDGSQSTDQNPSHTYTMSGVYSVSLTAVNSGGHNTTTMPGFISVIAPVVVNPTQAVLTAATPTPVTTTPTQTFTPIPTATPSTTSGTIPTWMLILVVVVILVLVVFTLILRHRGHSGSRRKYRGGDL